MTVTDIRGGHLCLTKEKNCFYDFHHAYVVLGTRLSAVTDKVVLL